MTWSIDDSKLVHGIGSHDLHFLDIAENGDLQLIIDGKHISFRTILDQLADKGLSNSFTLRMPQMIEYQINLIYSTFETYMKKYDYQGKFKPLYPLKVNQRKLETMAVVNSHSQYGLEAGTKSEFVLLTKVFRDHKNRLIMCNGVKDREYIQMMADAIKQGHQVYISVESPQEARWVQEIIPKKDLKLLLRIKPYVPVSGYWGHSASRNSKFGLCISELYHVLDLLKERGIADNLIGIHAHPGSQIEDLPDLRNFIDFMIRTFAEIRSLGFKEMRIIDFGGGLPIDYDNSLPENKLDVYVESIISLIVEKELDIHPNIMIESGRFVSALSSLIVVKPIDIHKIFPAHIEPSKNGQTFLSSIDTVATLDDLNQILERWLGSSDYRKSMKELLEFEYYTGKIKDAIRLKIISLGKLKEALENEFLSKVFLAKAYLYGNFSVFNSVADHVMVNQYFPVFAAFDLHDQPETIMRLVDISCDSDGEISRYHSKVSDRILLTKDGYPLTHWKKFTLKGFPIPKLETLKENRIIIPLVGAYQDIVEFDHNLIGDLPDVCIRLEDDVFKIDILKPAESIQDIVKALGYKIDNLDNPYFDF
ncbi:MAG: hypothetical protein INQ03_22060 [Candidatus Heimdallarchaeota archaeon]|nr:hypothetical protein [Candidatus Heimdallarchaeota archaeon]